MKKSVTSSVTRLFTLALAMGAVSGCGQITYDDSTPLEDIVSTSPLVGEGSTFECPHSSPADLPQQVIRVCYQWTDEGDIILHGSKGDDDWMQTFGDRTYHVRQLEHASHCGPASWSEPVLWEGVPEGIGTEFIQFPALRLSEGTQICIDASVEPTDIGYQLNDPHMDAWWHSQVITIQGQSE